MSSSSSEYNCWGMGSVESGECDGAESREGVRMGGGWECLLFDLDDTLYPLSTGIAAACGRNIREYMVEKLGFGRREAEVVKKDLYVRYGTSMAGLVASGYSLDYDEYHSMVHGSLPYERLQPDLLLRALLLRLPQRKLIFTNADEAHASRALARLGLLDCFERILCFDTFNFSAAQHIVCKPSIHAFRQAISIAGLDPSRTLFFDDSPRNIKGAKAAGFHTVLVGSSVHVDGADYSLESIHNIADAIPHILTTYETAPLLQQSSNLEAIAVRA